MEIIKDISSLGLSFLKDTLNVTIINHGSSTKTFRFFNENGLPNVDDNDDINTLSDIDIGRSVNNMIVVENVNKTYLATNNGVTIVETSTNQVIENLILNSTTSITYDSVRNRIYASSEFDIYIIDANTNSLLNTISFPVISGADVKWVIYSNTTDRVYFLQGKAPFPTLGWYIFVIDPNNYSITNSSSALPDSISNFNISNDIVPKIIESIGCIVFWYNAGQTGFTYLAKVNMVSLNISVVDLSTFQIPIQPTLTYTNSGVNYSLLTYPTTFPSDNIQLVNLIDNSISNYAIGVDINSGALGQCSISGNIIYTSDQTSSIYKNTVYRFDLSTNTNLPIIQTPSSPIDNTYTCIYNENNGYLYVGLKSNNKLYVLDSNNSFNVIYSFDTLSIPRNQFNINTYSITNSDLVLPSFNGAIFIDSYPQVEIIVNDGLFSIEALLQFIRFSPICVNNTKYDTMVRENITYPLLYQTTTSAGEIESTKVNLIKNFTAYNSDVVTSINLPKEQFPSCVYDGINYIQSNILGNNTISIIFDYVQVSAQENYSETKSIVKKKYTRASYRVFSAQNK